MPFAPSCTTTSSSLRSFSTRSRTKAHLVRRCSPAFFPPPCFCWLTVQLPLFFVHTHTSVRPAPHLPLLPPPPTDPTPACPPSPLSRVCRVARAQAPFPPRTLKPNRNTDQHTPRHRDRRRRDSPAGASFFFQLKQPPQQRRRTRESREKEGARARGIFAAAAAPPPPPPPPKRRREPPMIWETERESSFHPLLVFLFLQTTILV